MARFLAPARLSCWESRFGLTMVQILRRSVLANLAFLFRQNFIPSGGRRKLLLLFLLKKRCRMRLMVLMITRTTSFSTVRLWWFFVLLIVPFWRLKLLMKGRVLIMVLLLLLIIILIFKFPRTFFIKIRVVLGLLGRCRPLLLLGWLLLLVRLTLNRRVSQMVLWRGRFRQTFFPLIVRPRQSVLLLSLRRISPQRLSLTVFRMVPRVMKNVFRRLLIIKMISAFWRPTFRL